MKKKSRTFKFAVAFILLLGAWVFLAPFLAYWLIVEKPIENADVILVLGGSAVYEERTEKAAELYRKSAAPRVVLTDDGERTGWSRLEKRNIPYVEMAQRNLVALGVPVEKIEIVKPAGSGTIYEARALKEKSAAENWRRILIVTSAYHTRRAARTFDGVFAEDENAAIGIAAPPTGRQTPSPLYWWLTTRGWNFVAGEYAKSFYYRLYY